MSLSYVEIDVQILADMLGLGDHQIRIVNVANSYPSRVRINIDADWLEGGEHVATYLKRLDGTSLLVDLRKKS